MQLALYIHSIGIEPNITGQNYRAYVGNLDRQFQQLDYGRRQEAEQRGRKLINEVGFEAATANLVPIPPNQLRRERVRQKRLERMKCWPVDTPPCSSCKFRYLKLPKKSWPSLESAQSELAKHKNTRVVVYPCPANQGYWHLGRLKQKYLKEKPVSNPNDK
jgi:hypothetical protein